LSSIGIFKEKENKYFELTPPAEFLKTDHKNSIKMEVIMRMEEYNWRPWGELLYSVKTGKSAFEKVFGVNLFEYLSQNTKASRVFNENMSIYSQHGADLILKGYDFSLFNTIVDIGGGHGILLSKILKKYPNIRVILFDLPHVIKEVKTNLLKLDILEGCDIIAGNFFESVPKACDLYIMKKVIHDWDDEHCIKILKNCYTAAVHNSKILLIETVINNEKNDSFAKINDIHMLVQTIGGRERTKEEFNKLLTIAGFEVTKITNNFVEGIKR
jgi:hypothetical protein